MNVYDCAHQLARAIKENSEYKKFKELKEIVKKNETLDKMLLDFQSKQMELQTQQLMGKDINDEQKEEIQELYQIILKDPTAAEYFQAEMQFSQIINDIYKILGDAMNLDE